MEYDDAVIYQRGCMDALVQVIRMYMTALAEHGYTLDISEDMFEQQGDTLLDDLVPDGQPIPSHYKALWQEGFDRVVEDLTMTEREYDFDVYTDSDGSGRVVAGISISE